MDKHRLIVASSTGYQPRHETLDGRDHVVVPVVALVQGVIHPLNAKNGPEFVPMEVYKDRVERWEGKPLFQGHPLFNGKPVRGNTPAMRASSIGTVHNAAIKDDQLGMEAWLDVRNARDKAPEMLARAEAGEPIEISVGVLVAADEDASGEYGGRAYNASWREIDPDHLALLPAGVLGACSRTMGCGVRALEEGSTAAPDELYVCWPNSEGIDDHGRAAEAHTKAAAAHKAAAKTAMTAEKAGAGRTYERSRDASKEATAVASTATQAADDATQQAPVSAAGRANEQAFYHSNRAENDMASHKQIAQAHEKAAAAHTKAAGAHKNAMSKLLDKAFKANEGGTVDHMYAAWLEDGSEDLLKTLRNISSDVRDKMPKEDFAGPNESFPIEQPVDVHDAAQSIGRAKGDRADIKRKVISIAYRKGASFVAQLPDDWKKKSDMQAASAFARFMETVRGAFRPAQDANEMGNNDLKSKLYDALSDAEPSLVNIEDWYPVTDPAHVVYTCYDGSSFCMYERPFDLSDAGVVTLGAQKIEVESVTKYEPVAGASPTMLEQNEGAGSPSSNGNKKPEDSTMKSEKVTKFLETATECQLKALEAFVEGGAKPAEIVQPVAPTEAELKALADARAKEIRDAISADREEQSALRVAADKKDVSVKALVALGYKAAELEGKSQEILDAMVETSTKLGKTIKAAVDFGGAGAARQGSEEETVPEAPDLGAKLRAAQEARTAKK